MANLYKLDISNTACDNKLISVILKKINTLKVLNLNSCLRLGDEMFQMSEIKSPIEDLNLSFVKNVIAFFSKNKFLFLNFI